MRYYCNLSVSCKIIEPGHNMPEKTPWFQLPKCWCTFRSSKFGRRRLHPPPSFLPGVMFMHMDSNSCYKWRIIWLIPVIQHQANSLWTLRPSLSSQAPFSLQSTSSDCSHCHTTANELSTLHTQTVWKLAAIFVVLHSTAISLTVGIS